jgi:antitoxin YefM
MRSVTASEAKRTLFALLDDVAETHEPVLIMGKDRNGVLVSNDDWRAIHETLHLAQIPGMVESIREGLATPHEAMSEDLDGGAVRSTSRSTRT